MPYILPDRRKALFNDSLSDQNSNMECSGELNYMINTYLIDYLNYKGESYQTYNDIIGALENAKLEFFRRKISPYEDRKKESNGDIYGKRGYYD